MVALKKEKKTKQYCLKHEFFRIGCVNCEKDAGIKPLQGKRSKENIIHCKCSCHKHNEEGWACAKCWGKHESYFHKTNPKNQVCVCGHKKIQHTLWEPESFCMIDDCPCSKFTPDVNKVPPKVTKPTKDVKKLPQEKDWENKVKDILWRKYYFKNSSITPANICVEITAINSLIRQLLNERKI